MKTLAIPSSDAFRSSDTSVAPLRRQITHGQATVGSPSDADALAMRRLLAAAWFGFGSFVAAMLATIPEWIGFARYAWLAVCLLAFGCSVVLLVGVLTAFAPRNGGSESSSLAPS
jgi:hypothetical protein